MTAGGRLMHATALALGDVAALIRGGSGSGKSDLALRCLAVPSGPLTGAAVRLVADDQVLVTRVGPDVRLSAPAILAGKLEVRGIGIVEVGGAMPARLALVVDLVPPDAIERLPEDRHCEIEGITVPVIALTPFEASAPLKLLLCLRRVSLQNH